MRLTFSTAVVFFALIAGPLRAARDVPVPSACTPQVNQNLGQQLANGTTGYVSNVMVCGVTTSSSHPQHGRGGLHEVIPVLVKFPDGSSKQIEVVTNDALDGHVTAPNQAQVFAYGRAFFDNTGQYAAGIDETHCATNSHSDNGWVVINGRKFPAQSCP